MRYRPLVYTIVILLLFGTSASAKVRDFQFIEDLSFAMPGEFSIVQGMTKAEVRRLATNIGGIGINEIAGNTLKAKTVVPTNITYGVSERFEISLEVPYVFLDNAVTDFDGIGDIGFAQKFRLTDQGDGKSWLSSGLGFKLEPPTGDEKKGIGNGKTDVEIYGIGMKEIGFTKWLVNLGYNFVGGDNLSNEFKYNGAVNLAIRPGLAFLMEFSGVAGTKDEVYMAPGLLIEARGIAFRLGTQFGMNDQSYKYRWNFNIVNSF